MKQKVKWNKQNSSTAMLYSVTHIVPRQPIWHQYTKWGTWWHGDRREGRTPGCFSCAGWRRWCQAFLPAWRSKTTRLPWLSAWQTWKHTRHMWNHHNAVAISVSAWHNMKIFWWKTVGGFANCFECQERAVDQLMTAAKKTTTTTKKTHQDMILSLIVHKVKAQTLKSLLF